MRRGSLAARMGLAVREVAERNWNCVVRLEDVRQVTMKVMEKG